MNPQEHFEAGSLSDALSTAKEAVKSRPTDVSARILLAELFCFSGELDRAETHLELADRQLEKPHMGVMLHRQLLRAETARQEFFSAGRVPEFLQDPSPTLQLAMRASICLRDGDVAAAAELLGQMNQDSAAVSGICNGEPFTQVRDLDDLLSPVMEMLTTNGKYYWICFDQIQSITFEPPERLLDLLWRRADFQFHQGPEASVYVPVLYPGTEAATDEQIRLGRTTDWIGEDEGIIRGVGQKEFLFEPGDPPTRSILELEELEIPATGE